MLNGSVAMPIFFILSGFSLSVIYGSQNEEDFNKKNFYRNRFARIYPTYFLTLLLALPLKFTDFGGPEKYLDSNTTKWIITIITNILLIDVWFLTIPINGPSWFVSILWFQYMIFPCTIKCYRHIKRRILCMIFPHVIGTMVLSTILYILVNFPAATMNIISPGFFMFHTGILCGLWCKEKTIEIYQNNDTDVRNKFQMKWAIYADISTSILFLWSSISTLLQAIFRIKYKANFFIQIYGIPLMIIMIISLTLDGGKSRMSKICRHDKMQFLGRISMSLYLIHYPLIQYFCVILQCVAPNLLELTEYENKLMVGGTMPFWGIFIMVPISLLAAYVLERFIETPCRNFLRSNKRPNDVHGNKENLTTQVTPLMDSDEDIAYAEMN